MKSNSNESNLKDLIINNPRAQERLEIKVIEKLTEDEKWVVEKGKSGVLPDRVVKEQLTEKGVKYNYPGFSNSKISPIFEAINTFGNAPSMSVTPISADKSRLTRSVQTP